MGTNNQSINPYLYSTFQTCQNAVQSAVQWLKRQNMRWYDNNTNNRKKKEEEIGIRDKASNKNNQILAILSFVKIEYIAELLYSVPNNLNFILFVLCCLNLCFSYFFVHVGEITSCRFQLLVDVNAHLHVDSNCENKVKCMLLLDGPHTVWAPS